MTSRRDITTKCKIHGIFLGYFTRSFIYCAIHQAQAIEPTTSKLNSSRQQVYNKLSFIIGSESWVNTTSNSRFSHVYLGVGKFHWDGMSKSFEKYSVHISLFFVQISFLTKIQQTPGLLSNVSYRSKYENSSCCSVINHSIDSTVSLHIFLWCLNNLNLVVGDKKFID